MKINDRVRCTDERKPWFDQLGTVVRIEGTGAYTPTVGVKLDQPLAGRECTIIIGPERNWKVIEPSC